MGRKHLLVEGADDSTFYDAFLRVAAIPRVSVTTPKHIGGVVDGKTNAIHNLPTLIRQMEDGSITACGVVVDADYDAEHGLGYSKTLLKAREKLAECGYARETPIPSGGFLFRHSDGLPSVGLWIMPNNRDDGMLEDFVKSCIGDEAQDALHTLACRAVGSLNPPLFKTIHRSKAEVSTWLAWQRAPGAAIETVVGNRLIDLNSTPATQLKTWMTSLFS